jgi:hypothetical protein
MSRGHSGQPHRSRSWKHHEARQGALRIREGGLAGPKRARRVRTVDPDVRAYRRVQRGRPRPRRPNGVSCEQHECRSMRTSRRSPEKAMIFGTDYEGRAIQEWLVAAVPLRGPRAFPLAAGPPAKEGAGGRSGSSATTPAPRSHRALPRDDRSVASGKARRRLPGVLPRGDRSREDSAR